MILRNGDRLVVPDYDATVTVRGEVMFEARVLYRDGMSLQAALDQAGGGVTDRADTERISVQYANGERDVRDERFMSFDHNPDIRPGSVVYVPAKPQEDEGIDWGRVVSRTVSVASAAATVMSAVSQFSGN